MATDPLTRVIELALLATAPVLDAPFHSRARDVQEAVTEALRCARGNGLVKVVPPEKWPTYIALEPPYGARADAPQDGA